MENCAHVKKNVFKKKTITMIGQGLISGSLLREESEGKGV